MATLANNNLTLADWVKRRNPDGTPATIANLLAQTNEILEDAVFKESNLPTGHRVTVATGLPSTYWRSYNMGVPSSKATTVQVDETIGMLEAYSTADKDLAELEGNVAAFRLSEDRLFLESMNQNQANALFYGNPANDPRQFMGFAPRYSAISGAGNAANIVDAGGTGSVNASIWLVVWGDEQVFCTFPKGSEAGLIHKDLGEQTVYDSNNNPFQAYRTHYQWKNGLVVKDWRYVVRIANIDTTVTANNITADMVSLMSRALDRIPNLNAGKASFYMNRTLYSILRLQALSKSNNALGIEKALGQFGQPQNWTTFMGVPLRKVDQLLNTEARVV